MRKIELHSYNHKWIDLFNIEKNQIASILGDIAIKIHHIGSTSIIGLAAKPIIDILIEVNDCEALDTKNKDMMDHGYISKGEFGIPGRRFYFKGGESPSHHIHAFVEGDANIPRHLAFRDFLRTNLEAMQQYQNIKQRALAACNNDINKYCDYKNAFIKSIEATALAHTNEMNAISASPLDNMQTQ